MYSCVLTGLALLVAAPGPKEAPKKEPTIVGEWVGEKAVAGGMELPVPKGGVTMTFTADGTLTITEGGRAKADSGSYKIDPKKDPPEIDMIPPEKKKEPAALGIYKIEGDTLTLCFNRADAGAARPKKFESPAGEQIIVITLKRAKKD